MRIIIARTRQHETRIAETGRTTVVFTYVHSYVVAGGEKKKKRESERKQPVKDARLTLINRRRKQLEHHSRSQVTSLAFFRFFASPARYIV